MPHTRPAESESSHKRATSRRRILGVTAAGTTALAGCLGSTPAETPPSSPAVIAHRGCGLEQPENTVAAVEAAAQLVDVVEVDVRRCATGELVVIHDETVSRVTDGSGSVADLSCAELTSLDVEGTGEPVPTLEAVFEATPSRVELVLDLKVPGLVADVLALHDPYEHDLLLSSFALEVLREARETDPTVPTARIVRESIPNRILRPLLPGIPGWLYLPENVRGLIDTTLEAGCVAIHPRYELCLGTDLVSRAHEAGLAVEPWTITTMQEYRALTSVGVDRVFSDRCTPFVK